MSALERTTYRRSRDSIASTFDKHREPEHTHDTSRPASDYTAENPLPLFLSDLKDQPPDPREFALRLRKQRLHILARVVAGGFVVLAFAILVGLFSFEGLREISDKAKISIGATWDQSAARPASSKLATSLAKEDPALASVDARPPPLEAASGDQNNRAAQQSQMPIADRRNEGAAPSKTLDSETSAALMTRAKSMLARGDIVAARLLLEYAANAQDATAAFLLARTYDPAVLGVSDARSITSNPVMAREWYRKAASLGSADAHQRLTQFQN